MTLQPESWTCVGGRTNRRDFCEGRANSCSDTHIHTSFPRHKLILMSFLFTWDTEDLRTPRCEHALLRMGKRK
jgi:hypothetical protein